MDTSYKDYICTDILGHIDGIYSKKMFGGYGIYKNAVIFAIIANNQLYFKVDSTNKSQYEALESQPFTYKGKTKPVQMSYWEVPEGIIEDPEQIEKWVEQSLEISLKNNLKNNLKNSPSISLNGQCLCGKIKYTYQGKTGKIIHCHCTKCGGV